MKVEGPVSSLGLAGGGWEGGGGCTRGTNAGDPNRVFQKSESEGC